MYSRGGSNWSCGSLDHCNTRGFTIMSVGSINTDISFGIAVFLWPRNSCLVLYVLYTDGKDVALKDNGGFRG